MTRTELLALYKSSQAAWAKVKRNADKLTWMDATRRMGAEVIYFGEDLARYEREAKEASAKFREAIGPMNWSTEQVVEFMQEAGH